MTSEALERFVDADKAAMEIADRLPTTVVQVRGKSRPLNRAHRVIDMASTFEHFVSADVVRPPEHHNTSEALERFVDADEAAKFLSLNRRRILELARAGKLPGHPIGEGARRLWRFRLSELAKAVSAAQSSEFSSGRRASMVRPSSHPGAIE